MNKVNKGFNQYISYLPNVIFLGKYLFTQLKMYFLRKYDIYHSFSQLYTNVYLVIHKINLLFNNFVYLGSPSFSCRSRHTIDAKEGTLPQLEEKGDLREGWPVETQFLASLRIAISRQRMRFGACDLRLLPLVTKVSPSTNTISVVLHYSISCDLTILPSLS